MFEDTRGGGDGGGGWYSWGGGSGRPMHYTLEGREPKPCHDFMTWALWYGDRDHRKVAATRHRGLLISTAFLGIDHNHTGEGPPVLFETALFVGCATFTDMADCWRACTWDEAMANHQFATHTARFARRARYLAREDWLMRMYCRERFRYHPEADGDA